MDLLRNGRAPIAPRRVRPETGETMATQTASAGYDMILQSSHNSAFPMASSPRTNPVLGRVTPGLRGTAELIVGPEHTAPFVGSGRIAVLATPVMINVIEAAALAAVEHLLPPGHQSLGTHLDVSHTAATPVGLRVTASAEVSSVEGRTISFRVEARDEFEPIGGGTHQRVVVSVARFDDRVQRKLR
jgi:fluoroacetyl-CoA thioesterase